MTSEKYALSSEVYALVQAQLMTLAGLVMDMPLTEFINAGNNAIDFGPLIDPTLWVRGGKRLEKIIELASALRVFQVEVLRQIEEGK